MPKSKANQVCIVGMSPSEVDIFKRNYGFTKRIPTRSPVQNHWEYDYTKEYGTDKEKSLILAQPHRFKGVRTNNVYGSRKAVCRIGRRHNHGPKY